MHQTAIQVDITAQEVSREKSLGGAIALMDACGNDAPLLWMLHARGYDLHSVRKLESETEAQNRLLREEVAALRRVLMAGAK
jgi:hypothetical protein